LLIGGEGGEERAIEQYFAAVNEPKQKLILPNTPHISGLSTHPQEYEETVIQFFDTWLFGEP
jgi:hypothetical protein